MAALVIRSPGDGIFLMSDAQDAVGRYVRRGELLGYVMEYSKIIVQVVVPQGEIDLVRKKVRRVELRLVERIPEVILARIKRIAPAATNQLPGGALSAQGGGELALDPDPASSGGRESQVRAANSLFILELDLDSPDAVLLHNIGSRIYVRFEHEPEPMGTQCYRAVRRVLLSMFNV
jgi:putative peptide zinc metalloprotease protein